MFANLKNVVFVAIAAVVAVQAQSNTNSAADSTPSPTTCIINCVTPAAASNGCSSYSDLPCVCTSSSFQSAALQCLQNNCTSEDLTIANQLQQNKCANINGALAVRQVSETADPTTVVVTSVATVGGVSSGIATATASPTVVSISSASAPSPSA